jgi:hypothetical protein
MNAVADIARLSVADARLHLNLPIPYGLEATRSQMPEPTQDWSVPVLARR